MAFPSTTNLVAYFKLDEASGQRNDSIGTNHLTDVNTVGSTTGKISTAASLVAASSESLTLAPAAPFLLGADTPFTLTAWVNLTTKGGDRTIVCRWNYGATYSYLMLYHGGLDRFRFEISSGAGNGAVNADALGSPATATWYFIVCWHDAVANTINIQVNDGTVNSGAWTNGTRAGDNPFAIGAYGNAHAGFMDGIVDEVGYWKRVLTAGEITDLYNGGAGLTYTPAAPATRPFYNTTYRRRVAV